jgi:formylglycine-generating enzyme required for sulfatase activity
MKLFISYAHVDWPFVQNLAQRLGRSHEVWFDDRLHAGTDWWQAILEKLDWCDGFLYVLSPESLASTSCLDEYAEAKRLGKIIIPARLQSNIALPDDLAQVQSVDFADRVFEDALADLMGHVGVLEKEQGSKKLVAAAEPARLEFEPEMLMVSAGPFLMGSDPSVDKQTRSNEPNQFELTLDYDYWIGKYPVTVGQFRLFVQGDGYSSQAYWTQTGWKWRGDRKQPEYWQDKKWAGDDHLPVVGVSWYEAYAYARWLAAQTGRAYRLPIEAEWEKAARGGLVLPDGRPNPLPGRIFPWGMEYMAGHANVDEKSSSIKGGMYLEHTSPLGDYPNNISPVGAMDMAGNVWEWCQLKYVASYSYPEENEEEGDENRVVRGGSWLSYVRRARCSYRIYWWPNIGYNDLGFRLARS